MKFNIRVVKNDNSEFLLKDLTEKEAQKVLANAYDDILNLNEKVRFGDLEVDALDLQYFFID
jgi:hypothetical protein